MGYNKPITARIQHSTNKGMKVQEPLLDIGSAAKQVDTSADASLISGEASVGAASQPVNVSEAFSEGMDKAKAPQPKKEKEGEPEAAAKKALKGEQNTLPIELQNAIKAAPGKNYKKGYYGK